MPTAVDGRVGELLERLGRSRDFQDSCSTLLHHLLASSPDGKGLILARSGGVVLGSGWRLGRKVVERAEAAARSETHPLARLLRGDERAREKARIGEFDPQIVLAFAPAASDAQGVLMVAGLEREEEVRVATETVRRCSPTLLGRIELEALRERLSRLEKERLVQGRMVESILDPVLLTDSQSNIVNANPRAQELFFSRPDDNEGRARAVRLNSFLFSARLTEAGLSGRGAGPRELNLVDPEDGGDLLFEMRTDRLAEGGRENGYLISVLREVTEVKRASEELGIEFRRSRAAEHKARQESERLHAILENVAEPILVTDPGAEIILMNREAERLFQVQGHESGPEDRAPVRWTNVSRLSAFVRDLLLSRESKSVETLILLRPTGDGEFPVEATGVTIEDERGAPTVVVTVLRDLTPVAENERLARELQALNEALEDRIEEATRELEERNQLLEWQSSELEKASQLKSQFLANMSHELRTPINAMLGYVSLLQEKIYGPLTDGQDGALGKVEAASEHLLELINDILDLSKIEAGKMPIRLEEVDLASLASEMKSTMDLLIGDRPIQLRIRVSHDMPVLRTDRTKLRQVLLNLLENAVKFTEEGSVTLRAGLHGDGEWVLIQVEDTGVGMSDDDLEHVFEDFRQGDGSRTREHGGAGLGLSISRRLVSLLGGVISVESGLGEGSRFTIELPVRLARAAAEAGARRAALVEPLPPSGVSDSGGGADAGSAPSSAEDSRSDISHGLKNPLQGILGYAELMEMGRYGELEPSVREVVEKIASQGRDMSGRLEVAMGLLGLAIEAARLPTGQAASVEDAARHAVHRIADDALEKGADLEVAVEARETRVSGTPDRLVTLVLALLRLGLAEAGPGTMRLRVDSSGADSLRLSVESEVVNVGTEPEESSGDPVPGDGLERAVLRLLVEGVGGRVEWADAGRNGPGPAVYLPLAKSPE